MAWRMEKAALAPDNCREGERDENRAPRHARQTPKTGGRSPAHHTPHPTMQMPQPEGIRRENLAETRRPGEEERVRGKGRRRRGPPGALHQPATSTSTSTTRRGAARESVRQSLWGGARVSSSARPPNPHGRCATWRHGARLPLLNHTAAEPRKQSARSLAHIAPLPPPPPPRLPRSSRAWRSCRR